MESHSSHWILSLKSCKYNIARFYCHGNKTTPCKELKGVKGETLITPLSPTSPPPHHHTQSTPTLLPITTPSPSPHHSHSPHRNDVKYLVAMLRGLSAIIWKLVHVCNFRWPRAHTTQSICSSVLVYTPIKRIRVADAWTCRPFNISSNPRHTFMFHDARMPKHRHNESQLEII